MKIVKDYFIEKDNTDMSLKPITVTIIGIDDKKIEPIPSKSLYKIYIELDQNPPLEWEKIFLQIWRRPPSWSSMHRPTIASIERDFIVLNGTTMEEIEKYHKATLQLVVEETNKEYNMWVELELNRLKEQESENQKELERIKQQKEKARNIKF